MIPLLRDPRPLALALLLAACSHDAPVGGSFQPVLDVPPEPIGSIDILFVIDDSGSMHAKQEAVIAAAGASLFAQLDAELGMAPDMHVAVVTTAVSIGDWAITGCGPDHVRDGRFHVAADPACAAIDGRFLVDRPDGAGGRIRNFEGELVDAFACQARAGTDGCGFEQPLEAMRLALDGTHPENAGFLRDEAMLLVVFLTDEDDCSASDTGLFDTTQSSPTSPLGPLSSFRCFEFGVVCDPDDLRSTGDKTGCAPREDGAYLHPVGGYVEFLRGLKANPSRVMVAGIFGDADAVRVEKDPYNPSTWVLGDVCGNSTMAHPAVRLGALGDAFPARFTLAPICEADMGATLQRVSRSVGGVMARRPCLLGPAPAPATCRAAAIAPDGARRDLPVCDGPGCVTIRADRDRCGYTDHHLAADAPDGAVRDGERLVVECPTGP